MLFLQCVEPDLPGFGESRVVRAGDLATRLPRDTVEVLGRPEFHFVRCDDSRTALGRGPVLGIGDAPTIRFRHDEKYRIRADTAEGAAAVEELSELVRQPSVQRPVSLGRGDILWLDNRRNLHGRTALSGQATRTLRTAWGDEQPSA
ncbi:TauD/TfdA family dioxygenase [Nonomuraea sp. CA-143628]|uniref:TauD/TfdA family dioxygenase n=1 Tax=Nonomuraea sp. CA-143628 TaxID=3239997 RepID=UPI003D932584